MSGLEHEVVASMGDDDAEAFLCTTTVYGDLSGPDPGATAPLVVQLRGARHLRVTLDRVPVTDLAYDGSGLELARPGPGEHELDIEAVMPRSAPRAASGVHFATETTEELFGTIDDGRPARLLQLIVFAPPHCQVSSAGRIRLDGLKVTPAGEEHRRVWIEDFPLIVDRVFRLVASAEPRDAERQTGGLNPSGS